MKRKIRRERVEEKDMKRKSRRERYDEKDMKRKIYEEMERNKQRRNEKRWGGGEGRLNITVRGGWGLGEGGDAAF